MGDVPLGGRSTLLGGTGVALGRDGASPFLNPATMGRIADHRLAFSVNFYRYSATNVERLIRAPASGFAGSESVSQTSFGGVPGSFCAFVTIAGLIPAEASGLWHKVRGHSGRAKLGLCGATIERELFAVTAEARDFAAGAQHARVALDMEQVWQRQSIGPSISYQLSERLTLGATLQVVTTTARQTWDLATVDDSTGGQAYQHHLVGSALAGVTTLGLTWAGRPLTFGVATRLPSVTISDSARMTRYTGTDGTAAIVSGKGSFEAPLPSTLSFGVGAEWEKTTFEFDVSASFQTFSDLKTTLRLTRNDETTVHNGTSSETIKPAVAWRVGGEHYISDTLSLLAGARYEPTNVRNAFPTPEYRLGPMSRHVVACSFGLGSYGSGMELLLGLELSHGFGRIPAALVIDGEQAYVDARVQNTSALLVLSGSIGLSAVKRTWRNFTHLNTPVSP